MSPLEKDLKPTNRITSGAVGPPGKRVFYLQARRGDELVTLLTEKSQLESLAIGVEQFLGELYARRPELTKASGEYDEDEMGLEIPLEPKYRIGQIGLGYDEELDLMILVARELQDEDADPNQGMMIRFWCTRAQLRAMCQWSLELADRGRPICGNCGTPIDPEGHFCPKRNGHKK